jgi:hypothetical protein
LQIHATAASDDLANDLVSWNDGQARVRQLTLYQVKIGATNATSAHLQQYLTWRYFVDRALDQRQCLTGTMQAHAVEGHRGHAILQVAASDAPPTRHVYIRKLREARALAANDPRARE